MLYSFLPTPAAERTVYIQNTSQLNNIADMTSYSTTFVLNESECFPHVYLVCVKWRRCYGDKLIYSPTSTPVAEIFYTRNTKRTIHFDNMDAYYLTRSSSRPV